jgi:hypothetical protein
MKTPPAIPTSYDYICPFCDAELEATRDLSAEAVTCPSCTKEFRGGDGDPVERVLAKYERYLTQYDTLRSSSGKKSVPTERLSTRAVFSMVFGLTGILFFIIPLVPLAAVLFGHSALRAIARSDGMLQGRLNAWMGLVLGYIECLVFLLLFISAAASG